jgi:hypothetical protein
MLPYYSADVRGTMAEAAIINNGIYSCDNCFDIEKNLVE